MFIVAFKIGLMLLVILTLNDALDYSDFLTLWVVSLWN